MENYPTSTGQWNLVVQRVSATSVEIWAGTLFPDLKMPSQARVDIVDPQENRQSFAIEKSQWQRPFRDVNQRFYCLACFQGLKPRTRYHVNFYRLVDGRGLVDDYWQCLRKASFDTLPERLPAMNEKPLTIGFGSCFYNHRDGGQVAGAYRALYERGPESVRPDFTFLTGDQVYLDIGFDSLSLLPREIRNRIADDYALHWQALGSLFGAGATWMLPDDHEYWNDFPFYKTPIPALWALQLPYVRRQWTRTARDGVQNIERTRPIEFIDFGEDLSICLADLRSQRATKQFIGAAAFAELIDWAEHLRCPGVLVIPQLLIDSPNHQERNLLSYPVQYRRLLKALAATGNDIVVLTGDVHCGRIAQVPFGLHGGRLVEVVASPLSNLTGLNGIATAVAQPEPEFFPSEAVVDDAALPPRPVAYSDRHFVSRRPGFPLSAYPRDRTREHFMTVSFSRGNRAGEVHMSVQAWRVRERDRGDNLPVPDFAEPFTVILNRQA